VKFNPLPQDDPMRRKPDIDRAKEILKWNPEIDLRTGLIKTVRYLEEIRVIGHIIGFSPGC
jgi:UDP-glucuronate decarboxylase